MKKLAATAFASALISGAAMAADLPVRGAPPAPVFASGFSWTGFYIGGQVGHLWSETRHTIPSFFGPGVAVFSNPGLDSFSLGGQLGYRHQYANGIVVGVEGDLSWLLAGKKNSTYLSAAGVLGGTDFQSRQQWDGSLRLQVGYAMNRVLPYLTGGVSFINEKSCFAVLPVGPCAANTNFSSTRTGWTLGAGVAYAVTNNWVANVEYRYADYGRKSYSTPGLAGAITQSKIETHKVLLGLSYKFGSAAGPVVAKY